MPKPRLEISDELGQRTIEVAEVPFVIGRRVTSDLHLTNGEVSRDHAEIVKTGDSFEIRDRGSRYGTFVNGKEVEKTSLRHGDQIKLGRSAGAELVFLLSDWWIHLC